MPTRKEEDDKIIRINHSPLVYPAKRSVCQTRILQLAGSQ